MSIRTLGALPPFAHVASLLLLAACTSATSSDSGTAADGGSDDGGTSDGGTSDGGSDDGGSDDGGSGGDGGGDTYDIAINEFMASNASTLTDEAGAYPDWIELYNAGSTSVDLDGFFITDDLKEPEKHEFAGGLSIEAGGFLVLFADGDVKDGDLHLGFNLASAGEDLAIYDADGNNIDALTYEAQATDWSAARVPDGSSTWEITDSPTPGSSNGQ
jgi:Lamin Tail Domain